MPDLSRKSILMIISHQNFRDEEFKEPYNVLTNYGATVTVASTDVTPATGMLGASVEPDITLDQVVLEEYHAVIFVGGSGSATYFNDSKALSIAKKAYVTKKILGAICIAPTILANAEILKDKKVTASTSQENALKSKGAIYTGKDVTRDGNIITADGPKSSKKFGEEIAKALVS